MGGGRCFSKEIGYLTHQMQGLQSLKWGEVTYLILHMDSTVGGGSMRQDDEWGEDTSKSRKMGAVYLAEGKNGRSILKRRKKWGEYT